MRPALIEEKESNRVDSSAVPAVAECSGELVQMTGRQSKVYPDFAWQASWGRPSFLPPG